MNARRILGWAWVLGVAAYFAAAGLELYLQVQAIVPLVPPERPDFDTRTALGVVRELAASGARAVPALFPANILGEHRPGDLLPLCGISTSTTVFCNESGDYVIYRSDEYGFNNPPGLGDRAEVIVLGDSFAHGQCVPQGLDVAGRLRARGLRAVNLGCSGSGPTLELATLVEYGLPLEPRVIVWMFYEGNDLADVIGEMKNATLPKYLQDGFSQNLRARREEIDRFWTSWLEQRAAAAPARFERPGVSPLEVFKLVRLRGMLGLRGVDRVDPRTTLGPVLARAKTLADRAGARILFVYGPSWARLHDPIFHDRREEVAALVRELGIELLDFAAVVAADPDPDRLFPFRRIGHLDEDGFALLAEEVARRIEPKPR